MTNHKFHSGAKITNNATKISDSLMLMESSLILLLTAKTHSALLSSDQIQYEKPKCLIKLINKTGLLGDKTNKSLFIILFLNL